uniref:DUF218 domain-containing protein n=1 Tax=Rhizochromulina marina TaxID=1034831 RepID=A0A7S2SSK2_9STRA
MSPVRRGLGLLVGVVTASLVLCVVFAMQVALLPTPGGGLGQGMAGDPQGTWPQGAQRLRGAQAYSPVAPAPVAVPALNTSHCTELVVVAGHAVLLSESALQAGRGEEAWLLEDYQRGQGLPDVFISHIRGGVQAAAENPHALLVFSGGQSRTSAGPRSEGLSYWLVAQQSQWFHRPEVASRTVLEEFSRDSFENLLFSIARFREVTGRYPTAISVVGFAFKEHRFRDLHRSALRFPESGFEYIGLQPEPGGAFDVERAAQGELENAVTLFEKDPYGCSAPVLRGKRLQRNPFRRTVPYSVSCPEIRDLLAWCSASRFAGPLPWDSAGVGVGV